MTLEKLLICPNCKEELMDNHTLKLDCACMKNLCNRCGKPVGNITFSYCEDCWRLKNSTLTEGEFE